MINKRDKIDPYITAKKEYVSLREEVIVKAKELCVDENTVKRFKSGTDDWLKEINNIHIKAAGGAKHTEIDGLLTNLLKFATVNNGNSLSAIKNKLSSASEQDIKYSFNSHSTEIENDLSNSSKHIESYAQESHNKGFGGR